MIADGQNNDAIGLVKRHHGTRVYVWIVTGSTLLLVAALLWPISVTHFESTANFQLSYDPSVGVEKRHLNEMVLDAMRSETEKPQLEQLIAGLKNEVVNPALLSSDSEMVRDILRAQNRPGHAANSVDFRISLIGGGTPDELEFVNALVSRVTSNLETLRLSQNAVAAIDEVTRDLTSQHRQVKQSLAENIGDINGRIAAAQNELEVIVDGLNNFGVHDKPEDHLTNTNGLSDLISRREALLKKKSDLMLARGLNEFHPAVTPIKSQIEDINQQIQARKTGGVSSTSKAESNRITNQFISSETVHTADVRFMTKAMEDAVAEIRMIDLFNPRQRLAELQKGLQENEDGSFSIVAQRINERAKNQIAGTSPISFNQLTLATASQPIGGVPSTKMFILLSFCAAAVASVVALNFDPTLRKRRFRTAIQIENKLHVPVVGMLRARTVRTAPIPTPARLSTLVLRICECTLLAILAALIVAALINSALVGAFLENPFHATTKVFWMIASK